MSCDHLYKYNLHDYYNKMPNYVFFDVNNQTTATCIDTKLKNAYEDAEDQSLVFIFNTSKLRNLTLQKLMSIIPIIKKYRKDSEKKLIETNLIITHLYVRRIVNLFLPLVATCRPVLIHDNMNVLNKILKAY